MKHGPFYSMSSLTYPSSRIWIFTVFKQMFFVCNCCYRKCLVSPWYMECHRSSPSLLMSSKYLFENWGEKIFILQFPFFFGGCKMFSLLSIYILDVPTLFIAYSSIFTKDLMCCRKYLKPYKNCSTLKATLL